jgi:hypothetical protein
MQHIVAVQGQNRQRKRVIIQMRLQSPYIRRKRLRSENCLRIEGEDSEKKD